MLLTKLYYKPLEEFTLFVLSYYKGKVFLCNIAQSFYQLCFTKIHLILSLVTFNILSRLFFCIALYIDVFYFQKIDFILKYSNYFLPTTFSFVCRYV